MDLGAGGDAGRHTSRVPCWLRTGLIARGVQPVAELPADVSGTKTAGRAALLPGLVDTHVHLNEPGRTEWEGFRTRERGRRQRAGIRRLIDMPLNCLPETTTVEALDEKRRGCAPGNALVDWTNVGAGLWRTTRQHLLNRWRGRVCRDTSAS